MNSIRDFILLHQAYLREAINGMGMILCLNLALLIIAHLYVVWYRNHVRLGHWSRVPGVDMACGLFWVFAAETYRTGAIWHIYRFSPSHDSSSIGTFADAQFWPTTGYLCAGLVLIAGLLRCTHLFAPPAIQKVAWLYSLCLSIAFLILSQLA